MPLIIREATPDDLHALVPLHLKTWRDTYENILSEKDLSGPTYEIRERQWRNNFETTDGSWFCFVVEDESGQLVGFAVGRPSDHPDFAGELNKIYLLREYQRQGLGRRLVGHITRRFLSQGISSMWVYADAQNPSTRFYVALEGEKLDADPNIGNYGWRDLQRLASLCPLS
jgi:ribosomal protein S18 acetylase RimI-like enzyme